MSNLKDQLQEIDGVGEKTAEKILDVVDETNSDELTENIEDAYDYYQAGQYSYAGKFLKRAYESL